MGTLDGAYFAVALVTGVSSGAGQMDDGKCLSPDIKVIGIYHICHRVTATRKTLTRSLGTLSGTRNT